MVGTDVLWTECQKQVPAYITSIATNILLSPNCPPILTIVCDLELFRTAGGSSWMILNVTAPLATWNCVWIVILLHT